MKKLLIVVDDNLSTVGGVQESTKLIVSQLMSEFNISVFQPGQNQIELSKVKFYEGTKRERVKNIVINPLIFFSYLKTLYKCLRKGGFDVVHTQSQVGFFAVALFVRLKMVSGFSFVHTDRGLYTKYSKFFRLLFSIFLPMLDVFVVTTKYNKNLWAPRLKRYKKPINVRVIENTAGAIFESVSITPAERPFTLGFAGRYCDWKDWPMAVRIIEETLRQNPCDNFMVRMCVGCLDADSEAETKQMFSKLSALLGDRFFGEINVSLSTMVKFYRDVDVFCLTSWPGAESFGRTVVEAMSCECVVLTTPGGGPVEVINDPNLVCRSLCDFVDKIVFFMQNSEALRHKGHRNADRARNVYSAFSNMSKHRALYSEL